MTSIEGIKQKIIQLDAGSFQNLCDAYLSKEGYPNIVSLGGEAGTRKTTSGTPDTYFNTSDGNYIFVEYTTQKSSLFTKIKEDLTKCFDISITGVPHNKILEIIYCHNSSNITPSQDSELRSMCKEIGIELTLIGIDKLAIDLYISHHIILRDFLGISMSTDQIQLLDDFIRDYNSNQMAAPIDTEFLFREKEIKEIDNAFKNVDIIILSGAAGTGKTRLALHYAENHSTINNEILYCVHSNAMPIFEDLKLFIDKPGNYFLFVDDANQLSGFQHVIRYANMKPEGYNVKILITVRDYALQKVIKDIQTVSIFKNINIDIFKDEEIKNLLVSILGITNTVYQERIIRISEGNARIAVLAGKVACKSNRLDSINDVSKLYEAYYGSLLEKDNLFADNKICIVAGILAFLEAIHLDHIDLLHPILRKNNISSDQFIEGVHKLHELEIVDICNDKAVRFSEQCLSNYLLKYVFYDKKLICLSEMIKICFQKYKERTISSINTLLNIFRNEKLFNFVEAEIKTLWDELAVENPSGFFEFVKVFYRINPTESILILQNKIDLDSKIDLNINELNINKGKNYQSVTNDIIEILGGFTDTEDLPAALDLFIQYYLKRPDLYIQFYHAINIYFGINKSSKIQRYYTQIKLFEKIKEYSNNWQQPYITALFFDIAKQFLKLHFTPSECGRNNSITIYQIPLEISDGVEEYRKNIWQNLLLLCNTSKNKEKVRKILNSYGETVEELSIPVMAFDLSFIQLIIESYFPHSEFKNCLLASYLEKRFKCMNIPTDSFFSSYSKNEQLQLYHLLKGTGHTEKNNNDNDIKKESLVNYVSSCNLLKFKKLIDVCSDIGETNTHSAWKIKEGLSIAFEEFFNHKRSYINAVKYYLEKNTPMNINPIGLISNLFKILPDTEVLKIINKNSYHQKNAWLYAYYHELPQEMINSSNLLGLYIFLSSHSDKELNSSTCRDIDFLEKYVVIDKDVLMKGSEIILEKKEYSTFIVGIYFSLLFNEYHTSPQIVIQKFNRNLSLLEKIYCEVCFRDCNHDYNGKFLKELYMVKPTILDRYIEHLIEKNDGTYSNHSELNRCFFDLDNYIEIYNIIFTKLVEKIKYSQMEIPSYLETVLLPVQNESEITLKQNEWINQCIFLFANDRTKMYCLFSVISKFQKEKKKQYYELFLSNNQLFEDFANIPFMPSSLSWSNSIVPIYSNWIDFLKSLLPFFIGIKWIRHKKHVEKQIKQLQRQIEEEQIREILEG